MMNPDEFPDLLNWKQAAALLGCSRSHFYALVAQGVLMPISPRPVNGVRVKKADCLAYLAERDRRINEY